MFLFTKYKFCSVSVLPVFIKYRSALKFLIKIKMSNSPISYDMHVRIEQFRDQAGKRKSKGPVTLIVGPTDVGKSTLTHSLLNLAASSGRNPIFIDLDVGQSSVSIPGTIGILPIRKQSKDEGFHDQELTVYFFGYKSPGHNMELYLQLIKKIGENVNFRLRLSGDNIYSSGIIIDTCGWITGGGYKAILQALRSFDVDILLVVGDESLYRKIIDDISPDINVHFVPKLVGVVERSQNVRRRNRNDKVNAYFYGLRKTLKPYTFDVKFSDLEIYTVSKSGRTIYIENVHIGYELLHQVLGVSHADKAENIMLSSIYGFVCFLDFDFEKETVKLLSPQPRELPNNKLLLGDIAVEMPNS